MAHSNWSWIEAVNPPDTFAGYRGKRWGRFTNRRLGSFWDVKERRCFKPCYDANGELINHVGGRGKTVDVVPHTQPIKTLVWSERLGEMIMVTTG